MPGKDPQGDNLLRLAAGDDENALSSFRERWQRGEPAAYITGFLLFRGRRFRMDQRAYVTDPELNILIDTVLREGDRRERELNRPLRVVEFGIGAGTLALTLALERPHWRLTGLDIDPEALLLAADNARDHGVNLDLRKSDFLNAWKTDEPPPDILYGDPPWGTEEDLYDGERDGNYYQYMPRHSVFPPGVSRTGIHDELLQQVAHRGWPTLVLLNCGILPPAEIHRTATPLAEKEILEPEPGIRILKGRGKS